LIRFEDITQWEDIKIHLINELKEHLLKLQTELKLVKMREDENVNILTTIEYNNYTIKYVASCT